ncbi:MAG: hypothetical protein NTW25_04605 [Candidatus Kapabacteria bacterium]|nr:hypothetical protein [Candidatus Kapabacteria bacterium]
MKLRLIIVAIFISIICSCTQNNSLIVDPPLNTQLMPVAKGNYWKYESKDYLINDTTTYSNYCFKDTSIGGEAGWLISGYIDKPYINKNDTLTRNFAINKNDGLYIKQYYKSQVGILFFKYPATKGETYGDGITNLKINVISIDSNIKVKNISFKTMVYNFSIGNPSDPTIVYQYFAPNIGCVKIENYSLEANGMKKLLLLEDLYEYKIN